MRALRLPLAALALFGAACADGLTSDGLLDFGQVYLPTAHEARYTFSNAATGTQTLGTPTFQDGSAFTLISPTPQDVDGGVPWAVDFQFLPPAGAFGAHSDVATFPVSSGPNSYSVTVRLQANFIQGDADEDGHVSEEFGGDDCDDADPNTHAGAQEICDGKDNDCDGSIGASEVDEDNDGFLGCGDDCDDDDVTRFPGADEGCDDVDTDCDGDLGPDELDGDGDGWTACDGDCEPEVGSVNPDEIEDTCDGYDTDCDLGGETPVMETDADDDGFRPCNGDCDDLDARAFPNNPEVCDGVDNDCDTIIPADELDIDGDGWFLCNGECDDNEPASFPGNPEVCDGIDNNCDTLVPPDESDTDGDSYADCADCAPNEPLAWTGAPEVCDSVDNDCNGLVDDGFDVDQDGVSACDGDCDDGDPNINPTALEVCNGVDDDCNGSVMLGELDDGDGDGILDCLDDTCPHHVDAAAGTPGGAGTLADPYDAVQPGIDSAVAAGCTSIWVHAGTYEETIDFGASDVVLAAPDGAASTILDGDGGGHVVIIDGGQSLDARLQGFTVTGGQVDEDSPGSFYGAGLYISGSSPTIQDNVFVANAASGTDPVTNFLEGRGAGAACLDGDANFVGNHFEDNDAFWFGGGIYLENHDGELSGNTFVANEAWYGGGVAFRGGSTTDAFQNRIEENVSVDWGGGVVVYQSDGVEFTNNIVNANTGGEGGGLYIFNSTPEIVNNTFVDNHATEENEVGGVRIWNGTVRNNLIVGGTGYGVALENGNFIGTYQYNDVWDFSLGPYLGTDETGNNGNTSVDPLFVMFTQDVDASNDDLTLQAGSPAIDGGNPAGIFDDADGSNNDQGAYGGPLGAWP